MITNNLSILKIHKLSQAQYERELAAGNIDENALYLTPAESGGGGGGSGEVVSAEWTESYIGSYSDWDGIEHTGHYIPLQSNESYEIVYNGPEYSCYALCAGGYSETNYGFISGITDAEATITLLQSNTDSFDGAVIWFPDSGTNQADLNLPMLYRKFGTASAGSGGGSGNAAAEVAAHNTSPSAHADIRATINGKANKSEGAFFVEGSGTTDATNKVSTWTGTSNRFTEYYDGLTIRYKIGVAGQTTTTLNINGLGAKQVYRYGESKLTTQFPVGSIIHLIYHTDLNDGCWMCSDYDSNTNTQQRVYETNTNKEYAITTRYNTTDGASYYAEYGRYTNGVTLNPSTNTITATAFKGKLTGNADTATKATQDASGNVIANTYETKADATTKLNNINDRISQLASETTTIPEYWQEHLDQKADAIQQAMEKAGRNKSAFLWYTDAHWANGNSKVSPSLLYYLYMHTPMNKVNFGGDIIGDTLLATREDMTYLYEWRKAIKDLPNHHSVLGNHDMFNLDTVDYEDDNYRYAFMIAPEETSDMVMGDGNYYYIDNPCEKTRYLYICYPNTVVDDLLAQATFIANALKTTPEGWHIVAIAHRWWQYSSSSTPTTGSFGAFEADILSVFDAYNARTTRNGSNYFYAQDFTDAKGKVEFCIGGHIHSDYDLTSEGGIPVIITTADTNQNRVPDSTNDSGTVGTITESAVYGIIADYTEETMKITIVGVGRGMSRVITNSNIDPEEPENTILLNLNRNYTSGPDGEYLYNSLDESYAYTNVVYGDSKFYEKPCTVKDITENSVTVTESGVGGVTVAYAINLPDITKDAYRLTFDYSGTGKCRVYYKYAVNGVNGQSYNAFINDTAGASGSADVTIPATPDGYTWLIIMFGSNTGGTKTYTNVSLTKT